MFYPEGKKIVPLEIGKYLNPKGLAYWIMDDGSWAGSGVILHTNNFLEKEIKFIIKHWMHKR